ncbi:MAG TPA: DNA repair exonuclease [Stellaceae bacterium]|nr:DNA repair exonuclease [Stellaceae bacterium]
MAEFRFLHAADIHLDSPMRGLEADPEAPVRLLREASREAFRNLIDTAIAERVAFLLIAGDLYDGDWQDWRTGLFFIEQARKLADCGIPLIVVKGNHDAHSVITRHLRLPDDRTLLPHEACGRVDLDEPGVAIHGQSFATKSVTDDLSRNYPDPVPGLFNIGLLHTALNGRLGHDNYAPTTAEALAAKGYDYWALGHVHRREIVHCDPWIVFPGNLQGRHIRESGPKGAALVTVRDGRVASVEHRPLDVLRWCPVSVSLAGESSLDGAMVRVAEALLASRQAAEQRPIAARIRLFGATPLHGRLLAEVERVRQGIIAEGCQQGDEAVWIEAVLVDTAPPANGEDLLGRPDVIGQLGAVLDEMIDQMGADAMSGGPLARGLDPRDGAGLLGEYPERLRHRMAGIDLAAEHPLREGGLELLKQARDLVLARLAGEA